MNVVDTNLRLGSLELDIVAKDGAAIAIIEVRTRGKTAWQQALASIGREKQARLRRAAALLWARRFSKWRGVETMRFDVICVDLDAPGGIRLDYFRAAFI